MPCSRLRPPTLRLTVAALVVLAALPGCSDLDEASAAGVTPNDLVAELADQLADAAAQSYAATYQMTGGTEGSVTQGQGPARTAYAYPGGKVLVTTEATTSCRTAANPATCTMTAPATVRALLSRAALTPDVNIQQRDTTIAGRHATCVKVGASDGQFDTCITNEGVLGSFAGVVDQTRVDVSMTRYSTEVPPAAFTLPTGAKIVDNRMN